MTRFQLAILCLLPLAFGAGCEDTDNDRPGGEPDADTDSDSDSDSDSDADSDPEYLIVATIPFEGVSVYVSDDSGAIVKDAAVCAGTTCTYQVPETGRYDVEAEDTFTFVPKSVNVDKPGEFQVSWITGGCASDPDWAATTVCDEWVPGGYGKVTFEGERNCVDEIWGREVEIQFMVSDEEIAIVGISTLHDGSMSGNNFYGSDQERGVWFAGNVTEDGGFHVYMWNTTELTEYLYYCD